MAISRTPTYVSKQQFAYDVGKSSSLFNQNTYDYLNEQSSEDAVNYALMVGNIKDLPKDFDFTGHALLNPEDQMANILTEFYTDKNETAVDEKTGETYNVYERNKQYLEQQKQLGLDTRIYNTLNDFEKFMNTTSSTIANAFNELIFGTVEGLIDTYGVIVGDKNLVARDTTGYSANKKAIEDFNRRYTTIGKDFISTALNDVASGIARMAPMFLPGGGLVKVASKIGYFAGATGNAAEQAVIANPDIDYATLLAYSAGTAAIEYGTEKMFGDVIFKKGFFNVGYSGRASKDIFKRLTADFATEGSEEMMAELANSILYKISVDPAAPTASIQDILYSGLIGGIIGSTITGSAIAGTTKLTIDDKKLGKFDSFTLKEQLSTVAKDSGKDAVLDLVTKNLKQGETIQQATERISQDKNLKESYAKAVEQNAKRDKNLVKSTVALAGIYSKLGVEQFNKSIKLLDYDYQTRAQEIRNYTEAVQQKLNANLQNKVSKFNEQHPNENIVLTTDLSAEQRRYQQALRKNYNKDVVFVNFGSKNGNAEYHAFVNDENTIFINNDILNKYSPDVILNKIVKEELVHTLQRNNSILSRENIKFLNEYYKSKTGENLERTKLDKAYSKDKSIVKRSERQARALAEALIFDDLTVEDVFLTNKNLFVKMYSWLKNLANTMFRKDEKGKLKYNVVLTALKRYRIQLSKHIASDEDIQAFGIRVNASESELVEIKRLTKPNIFNQHFTVMKENLSFRNAEKVKCHKLLNDGRRPEYQSEPFNYQRAFDETYYTQEFLDSVKTSKEPFKKQLQIFLLDIYGFCISVQDRCLIDFADLNILTSNEFKEDFDSSEFTDIQDKLNYLNSTYDVVGSIFTEDADENLMMLGESIFLEFIYDEKQPYSGYYVHKPIPKVVVNLAHANLNTVHHEIAHALSDAQGLPNGADPFDIRVGIELLPKEKISFLKNNILTKEFNTSGADRITIIDNLSVGIYKMTDGEINADLYSEYDSSFMNMSGFIAEDNGFRGYGRFKEIFIPKTTKKKIDINIKKISSKYIQEDVTSFSKTDRQQGYINTLNELGLNDYDKLIEEGYSAKLAQLVLEDKLTVSNIKDLINDTKDKKTMDLLIKLEYPDNKNITKYEDLKDASALLINSLANKKIHKSLDTLNTTILNKDSKDSSVIFNALPSTDEMDADSDIAETAEGVTTTKSDKVAFEEYEDMADAIDKKDEQVKTINYLIQYKSKVLNPILVKLHKTKDTKERAELENDLKTDEVFKEYQTLVYKYEDVLKDYDITFVDKLLSGIPKTLLLNKLKSINVETILYEFNQKIIAITKEIDTAKEKLKVGETSSATISKLKNKMTRLKESLESEKNIIIENFGEDAYNKLLNKLPEELIVSKVKSVGSEEERKKYRAIIARSKKKLKEIDPENELLDFPTARIPLVELKAFSEKINAEASKITEIKKEESEVVIKKVEEPKIEPEVVVKKEEPKVEVKKEEPKTIAKKVEEPKIVTKKAEEPTVAIKKVKEPKKEESKVKVKKLKPNTLTENIKQILNTTYTKEKLSDVQLVDTNEEQFVISTRSFLFDNEQRLAKVTDAEASTTLDLLLDGMEWSSTDYNEQRAEQSNRFLFALYVFQNKELFSKATVSKAETYLRKELSMSGTKLGLWSGIFAKANPLDAAIKSFKDIYGKDLVLDQEKVKEYKTALKNRDYAKQAELEEYFVKETGKQLPEGRFNWLTAKTFEEKQKAFANFMGKMNGFRYFALLTNPSTHIQNIISNYLIKSLDNLDNRLLSIFENAGDYDKYKQLKYQGKGKTDPAIKAFVELQYGDLLDKICKTGKYQPTESGEILEQAEFKNQYKNKWLQKMSDLVFDSLSKMDKVFARPVLAEKLARLIQANSVLTPELLAATQGLTKLNISNTKKIGDEVVGKITYGDKLYNFTIVKGNVRLSEKNEEVSKILEDNLEIIKASVKLDENLMFVLIENATNRTMLEFLRKSNSFSNWWNNIMDKHWTLKILMSSIMPFPRVVSNITIQVFQHSPINLVRGIVRKLALAKSGKWYDKTQKKWVSVKDTDFKDLFYMAKTDEMLAKGTTGTALTIIGIVLASIGLIGFDDDDEYSGVVFNFAGYKVKLSGAAPAISPMLIGAALIQSETYPSLKGRMQKIINDLTIFGTFDDLFGYGQNLYDIPLNGLSNYFVQYVPAILRAFSKVIEDEKQVDYSNWFSKTLQRILSGIPIVKELLPNKINPYTGEPIKAYGSGFLAFINMFTPLRISKDIDDYISNEAKSIGATTTGADGSFKINGDSINLKGQELSSYKSFRAKQVNSMLKELMGDDVKYSVKTEDGTFENKLYSQMTKAEKENAIQKVYSTATNIAKVNYWINHGGYYVCTTYDEYKMYKDLVQNDSKVIYSKNNKGSKYKK